MSSSFNYECILFLQEYPYEVLSVNKFSSINKVCSWLKEVNFHFCGVQCFRCDGTSVNINELMEVLND